MKPGPEEKQKRYRTWIAAMVVFAVAGCVFSAMKLAAAHQNEQVFICVAVDGNVILRVPLDDNARLLVADGTVRKIPDREGMMPDTDAGSGESAGADNGSRAQDINVIEIRNGSASCIQANCPNQVCVQTAAITADAHDTPIVCLPHRLSVYAE